MHVAIVGPINFDTLADHVYSEHRNVALAAPATNSTAPARIAAALLRRGHHVTVVTHSRGNPKLELRGPHLQVVRVPSRSRVRNQVADRWMKETRAMREAIREAGPDVVHSNWAYEGALAAVSSGIPHVATIRDAPFTVLRYLHDASRPIRLTMALEFAARSRRSVLTAVSPYLASAWQRQTLTRRPVRIIPNPFSQDVTPQFARERSGDVILEVADASRRKNVSTLIQAFQLLRRTKPRAQLRLVGAGLGISDDFARHIHDAGANDGVVFLGKVTSAQVAVEMASATIHAHAALEETFGNTLIEAMAAGLPILGGRQSAAVPWVLGNGAAGLLVDVRSPKAIAAGLLKSLEDERLRQSMAQAGHERVASAFAPDAVAAAYERAYVEAIELRS